MNPFEKDWTKPEEKKPAADAWQSIESCEPITVELEGRPVKHKSAAQLLPNVSREAVDQFEKELVAKINKEIAEKFGTDDNPPRPDNLTNTLRDYATHPCPTDSKPEYAKPQKFRCGKGHEWEGSGLPQVCPQCLLGHLPGRYDSPEEAERAINPITPPPGHLAHSNFDVSRSFTFDGHKFEGPLNFIESMVLCPHLYLAKIARAGDPVAREALTALYVDIKDADGRAYWPPQESK